MADIRPSWIGGDCPQNLSDLVSFLSQRASWIHKLHAQSEDPICPEFIKDIIARVWSPTQPPNDLNERASWAKGRIWLWVNNILTSVNWWLESSKFSGYPIWVSEPESLVRPDQHFSALIAWCKGKVEEVVNAKQSDTGLLNENKLDKLKKWVFSKTFLTIIIVTIVVISFLFTFASSIFQTLNSLSEFFKTK